MGRGGARIGTGPKSGKSVGVALARRALPAVLPGLPSIPNAELSGLLATNKDALIRRIMERQDDLLEAMMRLATGIEVEKADKDGETFIYSAPPDRQALEWLLQMAHGKPTQQTTTVQDTTINVIHHLKRPDPVKLAIESEKAELEDEIIDVGAEVEILQPYTDIPIEEANPWKPKDPTL